jgi:hypothetical protein
MTPLPYWPQKEQEPMPSPAPVDVVNSFLECAYLTRDYPRLRTCLSDSGFSYQDPVNRFDSADDLVQFQMMVGPIVQKVEVLRQFVDGDEVCTILTVTAQLAEKVSTTAVQWATVNDGVITRLVGVFDAHDYKMLYRVDE